MQQDTLQQYNEAFSNALEKLNSRQREAVELIDGAVLVVAGPGTGKTQLLAARIGYILKTTDTQSSNILCLTFTEAGAIAMRKRLLSFIGPEAYNVSIYTFHAFCNKVISENIEFFGGYYDLQPVSELEQQDIFVQIIDSFPDDHPLKRWKGNIYFERKRLKDLFNIMKQEGWSEETIEEAVEMEKDKLRNDPDMIYKRASKGFKKGDFNINKFNKEVKKYDSLLAASKELKKYNRLMEENERYDFNDMILWVLEKFKSTPQLLLQYQEQYQYFLVDEYQDTNGAQNGLLDLLASYWPDPNLFVVGDDDQSIFRFQGANMDNIVLFKEKYDPKVIILEQNYRSSQSILDSATKLINENTERLAERYSEEIQKNLIESRPVKPLSLTPPPQVTIYPNFSQEELGVAKDIISLSEAEEDLSKVAVIYRSHANVDNLVKYLEQKGVPLNIKRRLDALKTAEVLRILNILKYIDQEGKRIDSASDILFEILHYEYFNLKPRDIGLISIHCSSRTEEDEDGITWADVLSNVEKLEEIGVKEPEKVHEVFSLFQQWISDSKNKTLQVLFEKILTEGNIINTIMKAPDKVWRLQFVNTLFDYIKDESAKKPDLSLSELLASVALMQDSGIALPYEKIVSNEKGVNFITAHSSKGLEFKYVYIIRCERENWEGKRSRSNFSYPSTLVPSSEMSDVEDDRRLFFVAMTRAEDVLKMSYPAANDSEKELEPSRFLTEIIHPDSFVEQSADDLELIKYKADLMKYERGSAELIDHDLIDRVLENFKMSVTSLNKYLACPVRFYFENIIRVPLARNANMGFGKAIHYALEQTFIKIDQSSDKSVPPFSVVTRFFEKGMEKTKSHFTLKEYEDLTKYGIQCLETYYNEYSSHWSAPDHYKVEYKIDLAAYKNVPIKGVLDNIAVWNDHIKVTDYKTGKYKGAYSKLKPPVEDDDPGGDYWRQIVFYKMLLDADPRMTKRMSSTIMDFIEADSDGKLHQRAFEVADFEVELVGEQLVDSYQRILNHEFNEGCNEEHCKWCHFVNNNFDLRSTFEDYEEEDR